MGIRGIYCASLVDNFCIKPRHTNIINPLINSHRLYQRLFNNGKVLTDLQLLLLRRLYPLANCLPNFKTFS